MSNDKRIPAQFVVKINTKDDDGRVRSKEFVLYAGLLAVAHDIGLTEISTELVQRADDSNKNVAIVRATVKGKAGVFSAYGDASPTSVNRKLIPAITRVAETRAKSRCLRDFGNINMVAVEELGGDDDFEVASQPRAAQPQAARRDDRRDERRFIPISDNQKRALWRKALALGYEGDAAHKFIFERLGVEPAKASREQASKLLDALSAEERSLASSGAANAAE